MSQSPVAIRLQGTRYDFVIEATPAEYEFWFELRAIHRASGCRSVVNTVNAVMTELLTDEHDLTDPRWSEVPWGVSAHECAMLVQVACEMLSDERCLAKIEDALNEDRAEGEWRGN
jgi:hypothetical protein